MQTPRHPRYLIETIMKHAMSNFATLSIDPQCSPLLSLIKQLKIYITEGLGNCRISIVIGKITDPCVGDFELTQYVLRHVVLGGRIDDKVLIACGTLRRPVLVTLLLQSN